MLGLLACGGGGSGAPPRVTLEPEVRTVLPPRRSSGALTQAQRDSLLREVTARRDAWRAHRLTDYQVQITSGCFCPWPQTPAILEVRGGVAVGLRDTSGKSLGAPREPWALYTVEGLFESVERAARNNDVVEVAYDSKYDYPAMIRGDLKVGLPDDWFWVRASRFTPSR